MLLRCVLLAIIYGSLPLANNGQHSVSIVQSAINLRRRFWIETETCHQFLLEFTGCHLLVCISFSHGCHVECVLVVHSCSVCTLECALVVHSVHIGGGVCVVIIVSPCVGGSIVLPRSLYRIKCLLAVIYLGVQNKMTASIYVAREKLLRKACKHL